MWWLADKFGLTAEDARSFDDIAIRHAWKRGDVSLVRWLVDRFGLTAEDAAADAEAFASEIAVVSS